MFKFKIFLYEETINVVQIYFYQINNNIVKANAR